MGLILSFALFSFKFDFVYSRGQEWLWTAVTYPTLALDT